jgi:hypothetical protein
LAAFFILIILPIASKIRNRESNLVANFVVFICILEPIGTVVLLVEAIKFGIKPVAYLSGVALIFHFATNIFFTLVYRQ